MTSQPYNISWSNSAALLLPNYWTCFCFVGYFHMQPFRRTLEKKSTKTSRSFQIYILYLNININIYSIFIEYRYIFYILFIVKTRNFTERDFNKDLSYSSKVKYIKIYPDIMLKTSRLHHWVNIGDFIAKFENVFDCWG